MTRESLDPIRDKMIAALYGELSADEERALQAQLAQNDELRAEWAELQEARGFLAIAEEEEVAPSFVFATPEPSPAAQRRRTARGSATGGRGGFWAGFRAFWQAPVPGFAVVTAALIVLVVAGLRVDREEGALVVRFGPPPATTAPTAQMRAPGVDAGVPLEPGAHLMTAGSQNGAAQLPDEVSGIPVSNLGGYLTRAEFVAFARQVNGLLESQLSDEEGRRRAELAYVIRGLYDEMSQRHQSDYDELNGRIQQVWYGLAAVDAREGEPSRLTPNQEPPRGVNPVQRSMNDTR